MTVFAHLQVRKNSHTLTEWLVREPEQTKNQFMLDTRGAKRLMEALCVDFINSEFRDFRGRWVRDDLQQPGWMEQFLTKWGLQVDHPPDTALLTTLVALRTLLRSMTEKLVEGTITEQDQAALNAIMLKMPLCHHLEKDAHGYQMEMVPLKKDWDWVQAEIVVSFAHVLAYHDPRRLKICANTYCRGIFYDESKSRTKLYCTPEKCANLWKARRYRARHKHIP